MLGECMVSSGTDQYGIRGNMGKKEDLTFYCLLLPSKWNCLASLGYATYNLELNTASFLVSVHMYNLKIVIRSFDEAVEGVISMKGTLLNLVQILKNNHKNDKHSIRYINANIAQCLADLA